MKSERFRRIAGRIVLDAGLVVGGTFALVAFIAIVQDHGGLGYDTPAFWLAGRHVLEGSPLYQADPYTTFGLYTYPPIFAQLFVLPALLPELVVAWLLRISAVLCLRYLTGSWRATIVAFVFLPVAIELSINNVTLELAAIVLFSMRDKRGAYLLPWAAMIKFGPVLIVPYLWFRKPETRRPLIIGTLVFLGACLVSILLAPGQWSEYVDMLRFRNASVLSGQGVIHLIPSGGGIDFVARFALAGAIALAAAYWRRGWLAYAAASITCPVMAWSRFAPLVGLWWFRRKPVPSVGAPENGLADSPSSAQAAVAQASAE